MKRIETKVHSVLEDGRFARQYVSDVAKGRGYWVDHYEELVDLVAGLGYGNPQFTLLFRGQPTDYREDGAPSSLYPTLWRHSPLNRKRAWNRLEQWCNHLKGLATLKRRDKRQLRAIPERCWAILQHYSSVTRCETPLLDVTESIRVAASFATQGYSENGRNANLHGVVFVFGFPTIHQGTTISVDDGLILLRLSSVCPQTARRPHFQRGYLVGTYPTHWLSGKKHKDFSLRLIGKLRISTADSFWDVDTPLSQQALFPDSDALRDELEGCAQSACAT